MSHSNSQGLLRLAIPFSLGAIILFVQWHFSRAPLHLGGAFVVAAWGMIWVLLAWRAQGHDARTARAPRFKPPREGFAVVIGRARRRWFGRPVWLLATSEALVWHSALPPRLANPGRTIFLGATDKNRVPDIQWTPMTSLERYEIRAGVLFGDTLTLFHRDGRRTKCRGLPPEALPLLLEALSSSHEPEEETEK